MLPMGSVTAICLPQVQQVFLSVLSCFQHPVPSQALTAQLDRERLERLNIVSATSPEIVSEKQLSSPEKNTGLKTHADPTLWVIMLPFNIIQIQNVYGITFL